VSIAEAYHLPSVKPLPDLSRTPWRWLTLSDCHGIVCLVDADDYPWIAERSWNYGWHVRTPWKFYAKRNTGKARSTIYLAREIMMRAEPGADFSLHVDHVNGQSLDDRKANLRWVTPIENMANRRPRDKIPTLEQIAAQLLRTFNRTIDASVPF